ncbi:MAG TPA: nuclear transport factor 2 family protein [Solirubrobacterales bacterium]|nr:nuclear transport factor 2 family protein [Solirubrobacterales bacterium]
MSQENVEVIRRGLQAFNQGDLDRALSMYDPRVEVRTLLSGTAHGRDQVRAAILEREKEVGGVQYIPEDLIDAGDMVVGVVNASGRGRLSGISEKEFPAAQQFAFVWTLRGGLVIRQEMFSSRAEALEAAGLEE